MKGFLEATDQGTVLGEQPSRQLRSELSEKFQGSPGLPQQSGLVPREQLQ
jgi:hypothetical protein